MAVARLILVVCGVSGAGKSTVGKLLARRAGWPFYDADDFHPPANVEKMRRGEPLDDEDRRPWLERLAALIAQQERAIVACSALKQAHRDLLGIDQQSVISVFLEGSPESIAERLSRRRHDFMPSSLLESQFEALEVPLEGACVSIDQTPAAICEEIERRIGISPR